MFKRKVKPPGGVKRASGNQQQGGGVDDEWKLVQVEELQAIGGSQASTPKEGKMERGMPYLGSELMAGSGPASTLSTDSEAYRTPLSSLSEQDRGVHQGLHQPGSSGPDVILKLQEESVAKDTTIRKLQQEVNQLQKRLKYAEQLEEQNLRLTTEESKHEEEKQLMKAEIQQLQRKASVSRPYTRGYAHERKLQELAKRYEQQYNEELEENCMLREKISQLEQEMQELEGGTTYLGEVDDSDVKVKLKQKEQHIQTLQTQVESLQQHSKGQSKQLLQLKQELEALKATGEEIDKSWRDMVDQLEEENKKLSLDVGGLHRDKHFMEKSMEAIKTQLEVKDEQFDSENRQLTEQIKKLSGFSADLNRLVATLQSQVRKLEEEKEALQKGVQIAKTEAELYKENFTSERHDREVAHGKMKKYAQDVGELKAKLAQMEEDLHQHKKRLADVEQLYHRREKEAISALEEASRYQQEVQAKTSQVKQYKKQVDILKTQVVELQKHNEDLIQEMGKVMMQLEKAKPGKPKKKPSDTDHLSKELAKSRKEVAQLTTEVEQLHREKADLVGEVKTHKSRLAEKDDLLQAAQGEQLQLKQQTDRIIQSLQGENEDLRLQTYEKDQMIQSIQRENEVLRRQVSLGRRIQSQQAQQTNKSEFWEVPREEVDLNMQKFLGTGAWGFVVEGTFRGQQVAVKCLHDMIRSPEFVEVMRKEIGIMAQVRHPNLVLLIAAVMDAENDPFIVTELLDISLRKAYEKKRLQGSSKLNIFRDIAAALNYLHLHQSGEIIHRDVSSANVLLEAKPNNQWKAKLSDFGSAKLAIEAKSTAPGAPVYSAPEVRKEMGIRQTAKLDVYSYGILLCEVTVEQFPAEESLPGMMKEVQGKWAFMHRLITSCVQDHPDRRPTMSYVLSEFNKLRPQK